MDGTNKPEGDGAPDDAAKAKAQAAAAAPVIWLMGKTQAGKTSLVAALTGAGEAGIGSGWRRATREPRLHPWPPPPEPPVMLLLDTPGIGADDGDAEAEARNAMGIAEDQAHILLMAVRAEDPNLDPLLTALKAVRRRHPEWPVIVAQTRLHDLYPPGTGHLTPYPFKGDASDLLLLGLPYELSRALGDQRRAFSAIPGPAPVFVPVDLTREAQGLAPRDFGAEPLLDALGSVLPDTVVTLRQMRDPLNGARLSVILPWALAAAASEAPPLPFAGLAGATAAQGMMLRAIANRCGIEWDSNLLWRFGAVLGPGVLLSFGASAGLRQVLKLLPVAGTAAAAASSFGMTWAAGEAAMVMFGSLGRGEEPDEEAVREAYRNGVEEAKAWWRSNRRG